MSLGDLNKLKSLIDKEIDSRDPIEWEKLELREGDIVGQPHIIPDFWYRVDKVHTDTWLGWGTTFKPYLWNNELTEHVRIDTKYYKWVRK